jgi:flagellar hook-length control protein FliK
MTPAPSPVASSALSVAVPVSGRAVPFFDISVAGNIGFKISDDDISASAISGDWEPKTGQLSAAAPANLPTDAGSIAQQPDFSASGEWLASIAPRPDAWTKAAQPAGSSAERTDAAKTASPEIVSNKILQPTKVRDKDTGCPPNTPIATMDPATACTTGGPTDATGIHGSVSTDSPEKQDFDGVQTAVSNSERTESLVALSIPMMPEGKMAIAALPGRTLAGAPTDLRTKTQSAAIASDQHAFKAGPEMQLRDAVFAGHRSKSAERSDIAFEVVRAETSSAEPNSDTIFASIDRPAISSDARPLNALLANGVQALGGAQAVTDRQLNLARDNLWLDQLASEIVAASDSTDRLSFRLMPAHLGRLDVELSMSNTGLNVNIATSTDEAGRIVSAAQPGLIDNLNAQGVRVADTQITNGNDMSRQGRAPRDNPEPRNHAPEGGSADERIDHNNMRPEGRFA